MKRRRPVTGLLFILMLSLGALIAAGLYGPEPLRETLAGLTKTHLVPAWNHAKQRVKGEMAQARPSNTPQDSRTAAAPDSSGTHLMDRTGDTDHTDEMDDMDTGAFSSAHASTDDGRFAVAAGPNNRCYDSEGKHCGNLKAGALLTVKALRSSPAGDVAVCLYEAPDTQNTVIVYTRDLVIYEGNLAGIEPDQRRLLTEYGRIHSRLIAARRRAAERNPHAKAYKDATADYKAFVADVKRLTAARDAATHAERMQYADQLHHLKNEAASIQEAYTTSKQKYEAWKRAHPDAIDGDPAVRTLQTRLDQMAPRLPPVLNT